MRYSYVLMNGLKFSISIQERDVITTVAQLMENNGDTHMNIFVFCSDYHSTRFSMDELYSYCLENTISPVVRDKARMCVKYLNVTVFFKPVPKTMHDTTPLMGIDASIIFADDLSVTRDVLQFMWSMIRPTHSFSVDGTLMAGVLARWHAAGWCIG